MKAETKKQNINGEIGEDGNIDKIRDILFGVHLRDSDRKFVRMEERLAKEVSEIRDDSRKRLDELQVFIQNEIKSLGDRLTSEQSSRVDSLSNVSTELKELNQNFDKKVSTINEQISKNESDLRQQLLTQSKNFSEELQKRSAEMSQALDRDASELRADKADRFALAQMFSDMALRLTNDFKFPTDLSED
jgi:Skp family chaperone for outer membrane proteins